METLLRLMILQWKPQDKKAIQGFQQIMYYKDVVTLFVDIFGNIQIKKQSNKKYDKLIQLLIRMVLEPEKAIVMGGTWRVPVLMGLQSKNFVGELRQDGTFNEAAFEREYKGLYSLNIVNCWEALRIA